MKKNQENIFPDFFSNFGGFSEQNFKNLHFLALFDIFGGVRTQLE